MTKLAAPPYRATMRCWRAGNSRRAVWVIAAAALALVCCLQPPIRAAQTAPRDPSAGAAPQDSDGAGHGNADCSRERIIHFAQRALLDFDFDQNGLLYGVETHTALTRIGNMPGYNSCPLVASAILRKAGCRWARPTGNVGVLYESAWAHGWRPAERQEGGCLVAWNSKQEGPWRRIVAAGEGEDGKSRGVLYRQIGITINGWLSVDNSSLLSRPIAFLIQRPLHYEAPLFLCPP